jgi:hypothetical protein
VQSVVVKTPLGAATVRITGGQGSTPVVVEDMVIDAAAAQAGATLTDTELGRDASTLDEVPGGRGPAGTFGGQGRALTLRNVRLSA